eukprot:GHVS01022299.1.p1 GENE.GHVS01022299.1~~GHVS01022299.1.p1  ORF type:complete len:288 (+),score=14.36 GHVS01022299.1:111-974(+)
MAEEHCLLLDGMLCPVTSSLMSDPVCCVDGHSYERAAIESWLKEGKVTSPVTGLPMYSCATIPNHNLRRCIEDLVHRHPDLKKLQLPFELPLSARYETTCGFATRRFTSERNLLGRCLNLTESSTLATRTTNPEKWTEVIVFVDGPLRTVPSDLPSISIQVESTVTSFKGIMLGITDREPSAWSRTVDDLIDDYAWYINDSGWLHTPGDGASMSGWLPGKLKRGDKVSFHVASNGNIQIHINNVKQSDLPANVPLTNSAGHVINYYGFVALCGVVTSLRLLTVPMSS